MSRVGYWITRLSSCCAVLGGEDVSVTWTVKVEVPVFLGVPEITPAELRLKPVDSFPLTTDQL